MVEKKELALRYNSGKPRWSLVDFGSLEGMVKVLEFGAKKYSEHNWKKGLKTTDILDSLLRHTTAYLSGEDLDAESGLPHTAHILCNGMFLAYMEKHKSELDTRFKVIETNKNCVHWKGECCGNWDDNGVCKCVIETAVR